MPTFFRIIRGRPPTLEDFLSLRAQGRRLRDPLHEREWAEGESVYDDFERACAVARRYEYRQGSFVVELLVPEGAGVEFKQTFEDGHHFTLYAEPHVLAALVVGPAVRIPGAPGG